MRNSPNPNRKRKQRRGTGRSSNYEGKGESSRNKGNPTGFQLPRNPRQFKKRKLQSQTQTNAANPFSQINTSTHTSMPLCAANPIPYTANRHTLMRRQYNSVNRANPIPYTANRHMKPSTAKPTHQNRANTTHPRTPRNAVKEPLPASAQPPRFQWKTATTPTSFAISYRQCMTNYRHRR